MSSNSACFIPCKCLGAVFPMRGRALLHFKTLVTTCTCTVEPWSPLSLALQNLGHPKVFSGAYKAMTRWLEEILRRSCCRLKMVWKIFVSVTHLVWKMMVVVGLFPEVPLLFTNTSFTDNPATEVTVQSPFQAESCQSEVLSMCNHQFPTFHTLLLFKMRAGLG